MRQSRQISPRQFAAEKQDERARNEPQTEPRWTARSSLTALFVFCAVVWLIVYLIVGSL